MSKTKLQGLEAELNDIEICLSKKKKEIEDHKRRYTYIVCSGVLRSRHCGKKFEVSRLLYIQNECYVEPYSCTGGDYWEDGGVFTICPNCGESIRIIDQYLLDSPNLFKEKLYERNGKLYEKSVYAR